MFQNKLRVSLVVYCMLLLFYSVFSYSLTDPNLVLSSWQPYWQFQTWMWQTFFSNNTLLSVTYLLLVLGLFGCFSWFVFDHAIMKKLQFVPTKKTICIFLLVISPLLFSYNALSHDVFNYIFNAKMVTVYHANPHQQVALDFASDDWTRFMHNTHTPAPYGYGWTILSLLPSVLGMGKFVVTWLLFRSFAVLSVLCSYFALQLLSQEVLKRKLTVGELVPVFLNPLLLIEIVSNQHNDLWMVAPVILAVAFALTVAKNKRAEIWKWFAVGVLLIISVSIKYATLALLPVLIFIWLGRSLIEKIITDKLPFMAKMPRIAESMTTWVERFWLPYIPLTCSILLFLPLLIPRSQLFHPWYLVWPLLWLPLIKQTWWRKLILLFSFTSLLRYLPWMYAGGFEDHTVLYQQLLSFSAVLLFFLFNAKKSSELRILD